MRLPAVHVATAMSLVTTVVLLLAPPAPATVVDPLPPLSERVEVGAYVHLDGRPHADPVHPDDLAQMERAVDGRFDVVHYFFTWGRSFDEAVSPNTEGRSMMLSMKPDGSLVDDIRLGRQDRYIDTFAREAKAWGGPVYLRFGHEMNGEWMSYSAGAGQGVTAAEFKAAWKRLVTRVRKQGATNVRFVWSPNEKDFPAVAGNRMEDYWPGDSYVDVAGFDAYNWSSQQPARGDGRWRTFEEIVDEPYRRIAALTTRPIWLCEFGTAEAVPGVDPVGASKEQWFRDMFASREYPRLTGLVYFSEKDDRDVQRDWRLDSSPAALRGFAEGWDGTGTTSTPVTSPPNDQQVHLPSASAQSVPSDNVIVSVQALLDARGVPTETTGRWGEQTTSSIVEFQRQKGLPATGVVDALTWSRLLYG